MYTESRENLIALADNGSLKKRLTLNATAAMVKVLNVMVSMSAFLHYKYNSIYSTNALQLLITSFGESLLLQILALAGEIRYKLIQCGI